MVKKAGDYFLTMDLERLDPEMAIVLETAAEQGKSLRVLAREAGVALSTVFHLKEGNRAPRLATLRKLQEAVGIR